ncbi:hypothetical protein F4810DRAFT_707343 [Camillea tinctor]|nr:hypothetical protein F4810DRAFT_707343 [Camillea tinctor]
MKAIKRWLEPKNGRDKGKDRSSRPQISSPVSGTFTKLTHSGENMDMILSSSSRRRKDKNAGALVVTTSTTTTTTSTTSTTTTSFIPRDRGRTATLEWLNSGTSLSIAKLTRERECAARQTRRGRKDLGTFEVQELLRKPSRRAIERFNLVRRQAEVTVRYGVSGVVAYNFSRSLRWNKEVEGPRLRGFGGGAGAGRPPSMTMAPAGPYTPIHWLRLPEPGATGECRGPVTPVRRKKDVKSLELPQIDARVERIPGPLRCTDAADAGEDRGASVTVGKAQAIVIQEVPARQVREIYIQSPRNRRSMQSIKSIEKVSPLEKIGSAVS